MLIKVAAALIAACSIFTLMVMLFPKPTDPDQHSASALQDSNTPRIIAPAMPIGDNTAHTNAEAPSSEQRCTIDYAFPGQVPGTWALLEITNITQHNQIIANEIGFSANVAPDITIDLWGIHTLQPGHERHRELQLHLQRAFENHQILKIYTVVQHAPNQLSVIATLNGHFLNTHLVELGLAIPQESNPAFPITDCIIQANYTAIELRNGVYGPLPPPKLPPPGVGDIG